MDLSYIINQLGEDRELYFNAIAPPIVQSSNFAFNTVAEMRDLLQDEYKGFLYSRGNNPTVDILRKKLAALDGAEDALVFGSGAAAIFVAVLSQVRQGDHVVCVQEPYSWAAHLFGQLLPRFGVTTTFVDGTLTDNFEKALQPNTSLISSVRRPRNNNHAEKGAITLPTLINSDTNILRSISRLPVSTPATVSL